MQTAISWGDFFAQVANQAGLQMTQMQSMSVTMPVAVTWGLYSSDGQQMLIGQCDTGAPFPPILGAIINDLAPSGSIPPATAANSSGFNTVTTFNTSDSGESALFDSWQTMWQALVVNAKRYAIISMMGCTIISDTNQTVNVSGVFERQCVNVIVFQSPYAIYTSVDRLNMTNGDPLDDVTGPFGGFSFTNAPTLAVQNESLFAAAAVDNGAGAIAQAIDNLQVNVALNHGANVVSIRGQGSSGL